MILSLSLQYLLKVKVKSLRDSAVPWTIVYQASLSMGFSRQEYWSGLLFPSPGDLPDPGIEARSLALQADTLPSEPPGKPHKKNLTHDMVVDMSSSLNWPEHEEIWVVTPALHIAV